MKQACSITLIAALSCAAVMGVAAQPAVDAGVAACAAIESAVARLDCFDALARAADPADGQIAPAAERASEAGGAPSPVRQPSRVVTAPPAVAEPVARPSRAEERAEREEVVGEVAALRQIQPGRLEVTLTNGQVWRQTNSDRYNLVVGHEVKIYPTGFGEYYRLSSTKARGFIQVERVR